MKPSMVTGLGVLLIVFGILVLAYRGYTYKTEEKIAQIGSLEVTAKHDKTVYFPPMLGGLSLVAGVVLVIVGRERRK